MDFDKRRQGRKRFHGMEADQVVVEWLASPVALKSSSKSPKSESCRRANCSRFGIHQIGV